MFREIVFFAAVIAICESACFIFSECEYKGQRIEPGKEVRTEKDCKQCSCYKDEDSNLSSMQCCDAGLNYVTYPKTCKVVTDEMDCKKLVLVRDESIECTGDEGEISAVG